MNRADHLMVIIMEECAEVSHRVSKMIRFGEDEVQPGQDLTNWQRVESEFVDLCAVWEMLCSVGFASMSVAEFRDRMETKKKKVEKYMGLSKSRGRLES